MDQRNCVVAYPVIEIPFEQEDGAEVCMETRRVTVALVLLEGTTEEDAIFGVGEAICHSVDQFNKKVGRAKAAGRARSRDYSTRCTMAQLRTMVDYPHHEMQQSSVIGPETGEPVPFGIVKFADRLLP